MMSFLLYNEAAFILLQKNFNPYTNVKTLYSTAFAQIENAKGVR